MALPVNGSTHLIPAYYSFYRPRKDERLSWPSWLTYSGWLTHHISGHPSAAGRAQDRESSPARDRRSTTVPRHQLTSRGRSNYSNYLCTRSTQLRLWLEFTTYYSVVANSCNFSPLPALLADADAVFLSVGIRLETSSTHSGGRRVHHFTFHAITSLVRPDRNFCSATA